MGLTPSVQGCTTERICVKGDGTLTVVLDILVTESGQEGWGDACSHSPGLGMSPPSPSIALNTNTCLY